MQVVQVVVHDGLLEAELMLQAIQYVEKHNGVTYE